MVLHREQRELAVANTLDGTVVQIDVRDLERGCARDALAVSNHGESMVLSSDEHLMSSQISHRMIPPTVSVRELGGGSAVRQTDQLMAEADSKRGQTRIGQLSDVFQCVSYGRGITRSIGKKESVGS